VAAKEKNPLYAEVKVRDLGLAGCHPRWFAAVDPEFWESVWRTALYEAINSIRTRKRKAAKKAAQEAAIAQAQGVD